jgi:hypothetical protein
MPTDRKPKDGASTKKKSDEALEQLEVSKIPWEESAVTSDEDVQRDTFSPERQDELWKTYS